jgi:hypothetical protein
MVMMITYKMINTDHKTAEGARHSFFPSSALWCPVFPSRPGLRPLSLSSLPLLPLPSLVFSLLESFQGPSLSSELVW